MKIERNQEIDMTWKYAFKQSLPIMAGYVVLGMGFGVLLETKGYGVGWAFLMSCFIYAGSMLGTVLNFNSTGIDFSMTVLFLVVFVEQWRRLVFDSGHGFHYSTFDRTEKIFEC